MKLKLLAFGIARDIVGGSIFSLELPGDTPSVSDLKNLMLEKHPRFTDLASLRIAVNAEFAEDTLLLNESDEIALIPPVSGG